MWGDPSGIMTKFQVFLTTNSFLFYINSWKIVIKHVWVDILSTKFLWGQLHKRMWSRLFSWTSSQYNKCICHCQKEEIEPSIDFLLQQINMTKKHFDVLWFCFKSVCVCLSYNNNVKNACNFWPIEVVEKFSFYLHFFLLPPPPHIIYFHYIVIW